jgi:hypothetical protein
VSPLSLCWQQMSQRRGVIPGYELPTDY